MIIIKIIGRDSNNDDDDDDDDNDDGMQTHELRLEQNVCMQITLEIW